MVSDFVQKNIAILRIVILMMSIAGVSTTSTYANAYDYAVQSKYDKPTQYFSWQGNDLALMPYLKSLNPNKKKRFKIVIDPGHGGHDSGASGKNSKEKDLVLTMALKLEKYLNKNLPEVEVLLTRNTDVFIPLFTRIQYANEENADLFISLHCNYISNPKTRGTETFVMGLHRAKDNLEVAKRENASILLESNYLSNYDGYDPNSTEGHIMMSMYQNAYLDKSIEIAANIEDQFSKLHLSKSRGVKQAGFAVLRRSSMPAILVEAGFLSNETDEAFLISDEGQQIIVASVFNAINRYYENNRNIDINAEHNEEIMKTLIANAKANETKAKSQETALKTNPSQPSTSSTTTNEYIFKVQIAAFKNDVADMNTLELKRIGTLTVMNQNNVNKYLVGDFVSRESAEIAREKLKNLGYKGAFIVVFNR